MRFLLASAAFLFVVGGALAQPVVVGRIAAEFSGTFPGAGIQMFVDLAHPANRDGNLTTASLTWSLFVPEPASCTAGFKIKILRKVSGVFFVTAERGPFPVEAGFARVTLNPPIPVRAGDHLAVVQLQNTTICGSVGSSAASTHDVLLRYSTDFPTGSLTTNGVMLNGTAIMANASSDPDIVTGMLPVVGSTAGIGTFFRTDIQAINPSGQPIKGKLVFRPAGVPASPSDPSLDYNYDILSTASISDVVAFMGQSGLGSLDIIPSSGAPPRLIARIYSDNGATGTAGFTMESLAPDQALIGTGNYTLLAPADLTNFRMNVGVRALDDGVTILISDGFSSFSRTYSANRFEQDTLAGFLGAQPDANGLYRILVQSGSAFIYTTTTDNRSKDTSLRLLSLGQ